MRADLTFMALAQESNRYLLTRLIAKATRKVHRPNTRVAGYDERRVRAVRLLKTESRPPCGGGQQFGRPCCMTSPQSIRFQPSPLRS